MKAVCQRTEAFGAVVVWQLMWSIVYGKHILLLQNEAMWILEFKAEKKIVLETIFISGFLTKSTWRRLKVHRIRSDLREKIPEHRDRCRGRKSFKKSIPFNPKHFHVHCDHIGFLSVTFAGALSVERYPNYLISDRTTNSR